MSPSRLAVQQSLGDPKRVRCDFEAPTEEEIEWPVADDLIGGIGVTHFSISRFGCVHRGQSVSTTWLCRWAPTDATVFTTCPRPSPMSLGGTAPRRKGACGSAPALGPDEGDAKGGKSHDGGGQREKGAP